MAIRFTDNIINEIDKKEFKVRKRVPDAREIISFYLVALVLLYAANWTSISQQDKTIFIILGTVIVSIMCGAALFFVHKTRKLILTTEFQNAILSAVARIGTRFCIITKANGEIVYIDSAFYQTFPNFKNIEIKTIKVFLDAFAIEEEAKKDVFAVLEQDRNERILLNFNDNGKILPMITTIDLLIRPKGFFVLRGRDYQEKRNIDNLDILQESSFPEKNTNNNPTALYSSNNISTPNQEQMKNSSLIEPNVDIGENSDIVFSLEGEIKYVSDRFEKWLNYEESEIIKQKIAIKNIFYQYLGFGKLEQINQDFNGEIIIQRKDRSLMPLEVTQKLIKINNIPALSAIINL